MYYHMFFSSGQYNNLWSYIFYNDLLNHKEAQLENALTVYMIYHDVVAT